MKSREEFQDIWELIVEKGFSDYNSLELNERIWFNVESLTTGGLIGHYINHGGDYNIDTIEDLEHLGFKNISNLFREINSLFPSGVPPENIDERNDEIYKWSNKNKDLLDKNENRFWEQADDLEMSLLAHINKFFA